MSGSGKKWLLGCGIGCGSVIIITALAGTFAFKALKGVDKKMEDINATFTALEDRYGDRMAYEPQIDGSISADRMEVFLSIRETSQVSAFELSAILEQIESDISALKKAKLWLELVPAMVECSSDRSTNMLDMGMGAGEYQYIYSLAFFNVLDHDPADGPSFVMNDSEDDTDSQVQLRFSGDDEEEIREERSERVRSFFNRGQRAALEHQIDAYRATLPTDAEWTLEEWGSQLQAEHQAMELESVRMLWEDGLPEHIRASFSPYLDRLEATYFPLINPLELELSD